MTDPTQAMPSPESNDRPNGVLLAGRYRLERIAGRGGMAEVWKATDTVLDRTVAVKRFTPGSGDVTAPARQDAEMKMLAGLNHPGLVTVFDAGIEATSMGERPYVVMEFVDGPTLAARLREGPLPASAIAAIGSSVAAALAYVHARGIVHRDIKPANILLEGGDVAGPTTVKLADFGIARLVDEARVTKTGMTVGTASYLSPEQVRGSEVSAASDIYSLGLVLLEAFTGTVEFPGTPIEAAVARLNRDPVIPGRVGPVWGPLLAAMTAREPSLRPTADEVAGRLSHVTGATPPQSATTSFIPPTPAGSDRSTSMMPVRSHVVSAGGPVRPPVGPMPPVRYDDVGDVGPASAERPPRPVWPWILLVALLLAAGAILYFVLNTGTGSGGSGGTGSSTAPATSPSTSTSPSASATSSAPSSTPSTSPSSPSSTPTTPTPSRSVSSPPSSSANSNTGSPSSSGSASDSGSPSTSGTGSSPAGIDLPVSPAAASGTPSSS